MSLKFGFKTDVGLKRRNNQDSFAVVRGESLNGELDALFLIADGMGGTFGGEVASEIVVQTLPETVTAHLAARNGDKAPVDTAVLLESAIREAHRKVRQRKNSDEQLSEMGTTCVAAVLDANELTLANVGDSRAYLLRGGVLKQITQDHSSVWEQVQAGNMTPEQAKISRFRNQITRAIGSGSNARPDIFRIELQAGDSVLLCSDGLTGEVSDDEIARMLAGIPDPQEACETLVEAALAAGGRDNVTVIALRYGEFTPVTLEKSNRYEPESPADPLAAWKEAGAVAASLRTNEDVQPFKRASPGVDRAPSNSPLLLFLLFLLAVAACGEGYALVRLNNDLLKLKRTPPTVVTVPAYRATDHELSYNAPLLVSTKIVRDAPLAVDEEGSAIVMTPEGNMVRINGQGRVTPLPDQAKIPVKDLVPPAVASLIIATDSSGNRYQINPGMREISKYDAEGTLKLGSIGKGGLTGPTALTVDTSGNLYVIDAHHIKKIAATETASPPASSQSHR